MADNIIQVVKDSLEGKEVPDKILEKVPVYVKRAVIQLQKDGVLPPKILEFQASEEKEERRDKNNNLMYNFFFLPQDFLKLDKFVVHKENPDENTTDNPPYQYVSNDTFYTRRKVSDDRNFFTIIDYNIDDERPRKILIADPFPEDNDSIEVRYFVDGSQESLNRFTERHWEPIIGMVEYILGIKSKRETDDVVFEESESWRNQKGHNSFNKTFTRTKVRFPFGK